MIITDNRDLTIKRAKLFFKNLNPGIYILGTNKYGVNVKTWLEKNGYIISGFINDYTNELHFSDAPIIKTINVPPKQDIINAIVEGRTVDGFNTIEALKPRQQIDYFSLQLAYPYELNEVDFMKDTKEIINTHKEYLNLYNTLEDKESKDTLEALTNFRLNRDIKSLYSFRFRLHDQYFEPFIKLNTHPVFVDGGGFDGMTSVMFAKLYPDFKSIYLFEPNGEAFRKAQANLSNLKNVQLFLNGLWDSTTTLKFDSTLSSASKISAEGNLIINTTSIDEEIRDKVDYIKLDIEGAEYRALEGAKNCIKKFKPDLAICVYHNQHDFIDIPRFILNIEPGYKVFLRHYTQGVFETVMYFVNSK